MSQFDDDTDHDTGDELSDFEAFLREKDKQWSKPALELKPTDLVAVPNLDEQYEIKDAVDVADNLIEKPKSIETVESTPVDTSSSAGSVESAGDSQLPIAKEAVRHTTELKLHHNPILGYTYTEETVALRLNPEVVEMFNKSEQLAVSKMNPSQIIERFHKMGYAIELIRAQQQGMLRGLATHLSKLNHEDRAKYEKEMGDTGKKYQTRTRIERSRKSGAGSSAIGKSGPKKVTKSESAKMVDSFHQNGYSKDYALAHMKKVNRLDAPLAAYIESLVWKAE